ncbi:MAG: nuclear transport factor 2 family protein [Pseudomonadota bacterium]|nr:nuclear transport factor 2 family protein [Pseudomonadota bacterium]
MMYSDASATAGGGEASGRALIRQRLEEMFALRAAGDIEGLMAYFAEEIVCFPKSDWGHARYPYTLRGKAAVREAFLLRQINYDILPSKIHRVVIDGDEAIVHRTGRLQSRGGGRIVTFDSVDLFRFRRGLLIEFNEFCDGTARPFVVNFPF